METQFFETKYGNIKCDYHEGDNEPAYAYNDNGLPIDLTLLSMYHKPLYDSLLRYVPATEKKTTLELLMQETEQVKTDMFKSIENIFKHPASIW